MPLFPLRRSASQDFRGRGRLKHLRPLVAAIADREPTLEHLADAELQNRSSNLRRRVSQGAPLDDVLVEAFAIVREAARRKLGLRPYDEQMLAGVVLCRGAIAEMKTGEGKTLAAALPAYLEGLTGQGIHIATVNDYLARRDAEWMGELLSFLGLTVGLIVPALSDLERRKAYAADVTYATHSELGFDYLRDNLRWEPGAAVQRSHHAVILDEIDSILIDEGRTPLILSGQARQEPSNLPTCTRLVAGLEPAWTPSQDEDEEPDADVLADRQDRTVALTGRGVDKLEHRLGVGNLYDLAHLELLQSIHQALRARLLYRRDVDYIVFDERVVIVDPATGRTMPDRRWNDGLHQAVEAKEGVPIRALHQINATVSFQNYFRRYEKLAGMTGTAASAEEEFQSLYNLEVVRIPTHRPVIRIDHRDLVYRTAEEKRKAVLNEVVHCHRNGQPVLVGTASVTSSETLSSGLDDIGIQHVVLNAKRPAHEAEIIAQAGRLGAVTIATNMAGRGTDILLGGDPVGLARSETDPESDPVAFHRAAARWRESCERERQAVLEVGGLRVLGTERHDSERIDDQLRGRSGRQGDPGSSRFYLSLEDDVMRTLDPEELDEIAAKKPALSGPATRGAWPRAIRRAQRRVEGQSFEVRKRLLEYDDVVNLQREEVYRMRRAVLDRDEGRSWVLLLIGSAVSRLCEGCKLGNPGKLLDRRRLAVELRRIFDLELSNLESKGSTALPDDDDEVEVKLRSMLEGTYTRLAKSRGGKVFAAAERQVLVRVLDLAWRDHLTALEELRDGVGLRGYGQRDPIEEFRLESAQFFQDFKQRIEDMALSALFRLEPVSSDRLTEIQRRAMPGSTSAAARRDAPPTSSQ